MIITSNTVLNRLFQKNENVYIYSYFISKFVIVLCCGYVSYYLRFENLELPAEYEFLIFLIGIIYLIIDFTLKKENFYYSYLSIFVKKDLINLVYTIILILILGTLSKYTEFFSRLWFGFFICNIIFLLFFNKLFFNYYHKKFITKSKFFIKNIMIVGNTKSCINFYNTFKNRRYHLKLVCVANPTKQERKVLNIPHIYLDDNLAFNVKYHKINQVWVLSSDDYARKPLIDKFATVPVDLITVENTIGISDRFMEKIGNFSLYQTSFTPFYGEAYVFKMMLDIILSTVAIILLSPILLIIALIILIEDGRPIIFSQSRHGWDGYPFKIYKFRSLKHDPKAEFKQVKKGDERYLKSGKFIRKFSLDELPQLFNVIKGDMSLVGPRPHALAHNDEFSEKLRGFMQRHRCKPGITGLAQVQGFRGSTDTLEKMQNRYEQDLLYIQKWSFLLDIKIIVKTAFVFLSQDAD